MKLNHPLMSVQTSARAPQRSRETTDHSSEWSSSSANGQKAHHSIYQTAWFFVNAVLALAIILSIYSIGWEHSTRRYLRGFSDAIVPATAPADEKIEAILNWMAHGPTRQMAGPNGLSPDRDPTDTLNYDALLRVCGTATNAFINLVDSGGLSARRLLLLDSHQMTKHVVAEVLVNGRWIVADPAYRIVLRTIDGKLLTREELIDPAALAAVTQHIRGYDSAYTFDHTAHIRLARLGIVGRGMRLLLDRFLPGWEDSTTMTLLVERESFAAVVVSTVLVLLLFLLRVLMRWYGERRLGLRTIRIRDQVRRALHAFLETAS